MFEKRSAEHDARSRSGLEQRLLQPRRRVTANPHDEEAGPVAGGGGRMILRAHIAGALPHYVGPEIWHLPLPDAIAIEGREDR